MNNKNKKGWYFSVNFDPIVSIVFEIIKLNSIF